MNFSIIAMQNLLSKAEFSWGDPYNYEDINWLDSRTIPTKEAWEKEKARLIAYQPKQNCKQEAKQRIAKYDWINDTITTPKLTNKAEFYAYRSALRELIINPVDNPVWPQEPQEVWE